MVTKAFTETTYKGQTTIHIKKYMKQLFYVIYTTYINQYITDDGGQVMGEDLKHVQMGS